MWRDIEISTTHRHSNELAARPGVSYSEPLPKENRHRHGIGPPRIHPYKTISTRKQAWQETKAEGGISHNEPIATRQQTTDGTDGRRGRPDRPKPLRKFPPGAIRTEQPAGQKGDNRSDLRKNGHRAKIFHIKGRTRKKLICHFDKCVYISRQENARCSDRTPGLSILKNERRQNRSFIFTTCRGGSLLARGLLKLRNQKGEEKGDTALRQKMPPRTGTPDLAKTKTMLKKRKDKTQTRRRAEIAVLCAGAVGLTVWLGWSAASQISTTAPVHTNILYAGEMSSYLQGVQSDTEQETESEMPGRKEAAENATEKD